MFERAKYQGSAVEKLADEHRARERGCGQVFSTISGEGVAAKDWPELEVLPDIQPKVDAFDSELLPRQTRDYVAHCASNLGAPPDYLATTIMVGLASLIGKKICIRPKRNDPWTVPPNLWGANVGSASQVKTPSQKLISRFVKKLDSEAREEFEEQGIENDTQKYMNEAELSALQISLKEFFKKSVTKPDSDSTFDARAVGRRISELKQELENQSQPRRYYTTDATVEKLRELLNDNPTGMLLLRDELIGWLLSLERQGREGDRPFFLECWAGDDSQWEDRIGRGSQFCGNMCISIHGSITPGPLRKYVIEALGRDGGADGLLQRFQLIVWPDRHAETKYHDEPMDRAAEVRAESVFRLLDGLTPESVGATIPEDGLPYVHFDDDAQQVFIEWFDDLKKNKLNDDEDDAWLSHLGKYPSLMPSLALILHLAEGRVGPVSVEATCKAADWCEYLESHARRVYALYVNSDLAAAHQLANKIRSGKVVHGMKVRDLSRKQWSGLSTHKLVLDAVKRLEEYGWLRLEKTETGGRPSEEIVFHPDLRNTTSASDMEVE